MAGPEHPGDAAGPLIASQQELEAFARAPGAGDGLSEPLRGVLAETALTGLIRYDWELLKPLCHVLIDTVFSKFAAEEALEGPPRPMPGGVSQESVQGGLHALLDGFAEAPFTLQRLCEVLLEPRKQYKRLDKLAAAVEKLLLVTSTYSTSSNLPPRPALSTLGPVNENPPSPYMVGPTPGVAAAGAQAAQQLPNGQEAAAAAAAEAGSAVSSGGVGGPPGSGRSSAVFRMFMNSEGASTASAGVGTDSGSGEAGGAAGRPAVGAAGGDGMSAEDAAEAELAKRFVEDALRTEPEPAAEPPLQTGAHEGPGPASASSPSAVSPALSPHVQPQQQQRPHGGAAAASAAAEDAAMAAAPEMCEEGSILVQRGEEEQAAAAMDIDVPGGVAEQGAARGEGATGVAGAPPDVRAAGEGAPLAACQTAELPAERADHRAAASLYGA